MASTRQKKKVEKVMHEHKKGTLRSGSGRKVKSRKQAIAIGLSKARKQMRPPRVMITDKLASYGAAKREVMPGTEHRQHKGLNNRAENSHQPTRRRERQMKRFKSAGHAQRFLSAHDQLNNLFHLRRDTSLPPSTEPPEPKHFRSGRKSAAWVANEIPNEHCQSSASGYPDQTS